MCLLPWQCQELESPETCGVGGSGGRVLQSKMLLPSIIQNNYMLPCKTHLQQVHRTKDTMSSTGPAGVYDHSMCAHVTHEHTCTMTPTAMNTHNRYMNTHSK
jgi:hypothetical protein